MEKAIEKLRDFMEEKARLCGQGRITVDDYFNFADDLLKLLSSAVFFGVIDRAEKEHIWKEVLKNTRKIYLDNRKD